MPIKLPNLRSGEKVDIVLRRHWIIYVFLLLYLLGGIVFSAVIFAMFGFPAWVNLLMSIFWMYYLMFLYVNWLNYELDVFVFTNNRIVCVEQKTFLNRAVGETTLDKVQEVNVETKGLLANLLNYGTLSIVTAGSTSNFDMPYSPHPMKSSRYINNLVDRYRDSLFGGDRLSKNEKRERLEKLDKQQKAEHEKLLSNEQDGDYSHNA